MLPFKLPSQLIYFLKTLRSYQTSFFIHGLLGTIVDIEFINMKIFSHQIELWHTLHIVHKLKFLKRWHFTLLKKKKNSKNKNINNTWNWKLLTIYIDLLINIFLIESLAQLLKCAFIRS